jgi:hypothetical protein
MEADSNKEKFDKLLRNHFLIIKISIQLCTVSATVEPGDAAIYTARGHSRLAPL